MFETIAFYFFAVLTLGMALVVVTTTNVLYAMTSLAATMVFVSAFFFLLDAQFLGVVQILVYVGAVVVMYAFGMMFFNASAEVIERAHTPQIAVALALLLAVALVVFLGAPFISHYAHNLQESLNPDFNTSNTKLIGYVLFTKYLFAFEVGAFMLLVALVGAIASALKKTPTKES
ncbi:NADH-quinone oxidoreductase subunit J [Helicobacter ailurogastricus]|uniref:NADH-quinone oxidoreductase subunit J n=1 Tax=Helicobacter ailurogastricus TaxID=1578720 RepID=A0A0K2X935_9HELI|nr:NADH-quinone oxidoreductase subunit J [Helicobacter ailurogastricus]CRF41224.1 NADH-ubiquinone oxidoreductase chain J [Helicobacter ailurogastricus]CRF41929.1 NADH-ubiquinone oxidoreductase chain J [Helicobacter ailurogastricus]CRF43772.1 NADH-ubiquinone oxidoreductase chain J [Helicobacter ailurogastricus]CRI32319.1 NADH-ubiquinone oxidoreductase chain J [Helicobacter ailurogastricus]BDQ28791.1 NADH-quinone oxidoreductase subunit J [Helicobacter ailurogastricus]